MRVGRRYVIDIFRRRVLRVRRLQRLQRAPQGGVRRQREGAPGNAAVRPLEPRGHRQAELRDSLVRAVKGDPVSRPMGGCARTRRNASRPLRSRADASRIWPRQEGSRQSAGSRISTAELSGGRPTERSAWRRCGHPCDSRARRGRHIRAHHRRGVGGATHRDGLGEFPAAVSAVAPPA